jgi:hypothetical protein
MTVERIIADCDEHDIHFTAGRIPGTGANKWAVRIGTNLRHMRLKPTFAEAVYAAWLAYTGAEVA